MPRQSWKLRANKLGFTCLQRLCAPHWGGLGIVTHISDEGAQALRCRGIVAGTLNPVAPASELCWRFVNEHPLLCPFCLGLCVARGTRFPLPLGGAQLMGGPLAWSLEPPGSSVHAVVCDRDGPGTAGGTPGTRPVFQSLGSWLARGRQGRVRTHLIPFGSSWFLCQIVLLARVAF